MFIEAFPALGKRLAGIDRKLSEQSLEKIIEIIKSTLESGEDVMVSGFGKFSVDQKEIRKGRNPATGEDLMLAGQKGCDIQKFRLVERPHK